MERKQYSGRPMRHPKQRLKTRVARTAKKAGTKTKAHLRKNLVERFSHFRQVRLLVVEWFLLISALICLAVIQLLSYQNSYSTLAAADGGTYTEATVGDITSLNPLYASTSTEKVLARLMFATLTRVDTAGQVGLGLASSLTPVDEKGETWRLTLRDDLQWSDGEPITLDDVLFTVEVIQSDATNTNYESNLAGVTVEKVADENGEALLFTLPAAYADFPASLELPILPAHAFEGVDPAQILQSDFSLNPVTSGAFTYRATQVAENTTDGNLATVFLSANPHYYLGEPKVDTFAVRAYATTDEVIAAMNSGAATATAELPASRAADLTAENIYERTTTLNSGVYVFFNTASDALKSRAVRQAIAEGLDVNAVRAAAPDSVALNYPLLAGQLELTEWPAVRSYNLAAAQEKLAGKTEQPLNLATVNSGYLSAVAEAVKTQLEALGFTVNMSVYEPGQDFLMNVIYARNYDVLVYEIDLGVEPDPFAYYHSSQASKSGLNLSNYRNAIADELLLSARTTLDEGKRADYLRRFVEQWLNDVPAIGLYQTDAAYFYNKNSSNTAPENRLASPLDRFADVQNWSTQQEVVKRTP